MRVNVTFDRLREILSTVNPNTVKVVTVTPTGSCSGHIDWIEFGIGYKTYDLMVADVDSYYNQVGIQMAMGLIEDFKDSINFDVKEYEYYTDNKCEKAVFKLDKQRPVNVTVKISCTHVFEVTPEFMKDMNMTQQQAIDYWIESLLTYREDMMIALDDATNHSIELLRIY